MQLERTVRLMAMKENRHGNDGDVGQRKRHQHVSPPRQIDQTAEH
jgi:hypothetical protein